MQYRHPALWGIMYPYITVFQWTLPAYGLCYAVAIVVCFGCAAWRAVQDNLSVDHLLIIAAVSIGTALAGAKLLYCIVTYSGRELLAMIKTGVWTGLFSSGFIFYGGLLGGLIGAYLGAKIAGTSLMQYENAIVPFLPLGYGIGRVGCFLAGCCYGVLYHGKHFPVQLLDSVVSIAVFLCLVFLSRRKRRSYTLLITYLSVYAIQRFLLEFLRGDSIRGSYGGLFTSQWISLVLLALCVFFAWRRNGVNGQKSHIKYERK